MLTERLFAIAQGGAEFILWVMVILSVISISIILERFFTLRAIREQSKKIKKVVHEILQSYNLKDLEELAKNKDSLEGRALAYGLRHAKESGEKGLSEIFNSYALIEKPQLEKSLSFLATIASNAPYVGLLGTVLGIMKAFKDLSMNPGAGNEAVMLGIAEALVSTAVGLLVAIPATVAYNSFQKQVKQILQSIDAVAELCLAYVKRQK